MKTEDGVKANKSFTGDFPRRKIGSRLIGAMTATTSATVTAPQMVSGLKNHQAVFKIKIVGQNFGLRCPGSF